MVWQTCKISCFVFSFLFFFFGGGDGEGQADNVQDYPDPVDQRLGKCVSDTHAD